MSQETPDLRDCLAIWAIPGVGSMMSKRLISYAGGVKELFGKKGRELQHIPGIGENLADVITKEDYYRKADEMLEFSQKYGIDILTWYSKDYPERLKLCEDSPLVLFVKGQPIDPKKKYLAVVGTRNATPRGQAFCKELLEEIHSHRTDVCTVSGLAYGIDIAMHKASVDLGVPTYGVLAHGLDTIYPTAHRDIATAMLKEGGLVTEFFPKVFPDKTNFVRRNRIIAGLSDATLVVESDVKGGALITAQLANSYNRDVFALPGRNSDKYSSGCNMLIKTCQANLIESFADIEYFLNWDNQPKAIQKQMFVELDAESQKVYDALQNDDLPIDAICRVTGMTMPKVSSLLLPMELKGLVKGLPGKVYTRL